MTELKPVRQLNLAQTSAIVIGTVIGSGIFINLPIVARIAGSPGLATMIWLVGGIFWIPQILLLAEMGTAYPDQGFAYDYLKRAGSPFLAFLYTWTAFLTSDTPSLTIIALSASSALSFFVPGLSSPLYAKSFAIGLIMVLTLIHLRSVQGGGNFQIFFTIAKIAPLILLVVIGMAYLGSGKFFMSPEPGFIESHGWLGVLVGGISATVWSYAGFGNILYMAGEVKNPGRTLPIALIGSLVFVMVSYTLISAAASAIVPFPDMLKAEGGFVNPFAFLPFLSNYAGGFLAIAAFISMVGVLNASIMAQPRLEYAIARDGLFFESFGKLHPRYLTPANSILFQSGFSIVLFLLGDLNTLLGYFTLSYTLQNILVYGAIFFLKKRTDYHPTYHSPAWKTMAVLAILSQLGLAAGAAVAFDAKGVLFSLGLICTSVPAYYYFRYQMQKKVRI